MAHDQLAAGSVRSRAKYGGAPSSSWAPIDAHVRPSPENARATAAPIPLVPPVIRQIFPPSSMPLLRCLWSVCARRLV